MRQRHLFYLVGSQERKGLGFCCLCLTPVPHSPHRPPLLPLILYPDTLSPILTSPRHLCGMVGRALLIQNSAFILLWRPQRAWGHRIKFCNLITFWPSVNCSIPPWILSIDVYCCVCTAAVTAHGMISLGVCNPMFYSTFHLTGVNGNRTFLPSCLERESLLGCCIDT